MHDNEWEWLQGLTFGALVFANPRPGDRPLPELIAGADLDGDLFFVCWEETIVPLIQPIPITHSELVMLSDEAKIRVLAYGPNWFDTAQSFIMQVPTLHAHIDHLVGKLCKKS